MESRFLVAACKSCMHRLGQSKAKEEDRDARWMYIRKSARCVLSSVLMASLCESSREEMPLWCPGFPLTLVQAWLVQTSKSGWKERRELRKRLLVRGGTFPHCYSRYTISRPCQQWYRRSTEVILWGVLLHFMLLCISELSTVLFNGTIHV